MKRTTDSAPLLTATALVLLACAPRAAVGQALKPWESMEWTVDCTPELRASLAAAHTAGETVPGEARVCYPDSPISAAAAARYELETASVWLRDLGFAGPLVAERDGVRYRARIHTFKPRFADSCEHSRASFDLDDHVIRISPCSHFGVVPVDELGVLANRGALLGLGPVHELFHAIQLGYPKVNTSKPARWILEGTATLVEVAAARRGGSVYADPVAVRRFFDQQLHVPVTVPDESDADWQRWTYGTWEFWDFVGEVLESPDRIAYLHRILQEDLAGTNGLHGVEAGLRALGSEGLYDLYPAFVAARLDEPCYFEPLGIFDPLQAGAPCEPDASGEGRIDLRAGETSRVTVNPAALATDAFVVRTDVPVESVGLLRVEIPASADAPEYHLVVGNQRRDVEVFPGHFRDGARNRYVGTLSGGRDETLVKVAHVPADLSSVEGGEGLAFGPEIPVDVSLERIQGVVEFSGGISGSYRVRDGLALGALPAPGGSACVMSIMLTPAGGSGEYVILAGELPRPLQPGTLPITTALSGPATVNVQSAPGIDRPGRSGFMRPELADGGTFELLRVTPGVVEARFRANVPAQGTAAAAHTIDAHFVARMGEWARQEAHACYPF